MVIVNYRDISYRENTHFRATMRKVLNGGENR
jgi:hypothetical protein